MFRLRPRAEADLERIVDYIAADAPNASIRWLEEMLATCRKLGNMPAMGADRSDIRPGLRTFPVGNYMIIYRAIDSGAEIVRVFHGARRWQELL